MDKNYYEAVTQMEKMQVNREYTLGWMGGYLLNPMREEQRVTEAYEAGHADGTKQTKSNFANWVKK
jgi:hypothetical protein